METENPQLYGRLTSDLTAENVKAIQEIFKLGEQRNEARRSKKIEEAGGKNNVLSFYGFKIILGCPNHFGLISIACKIITGQLSKIAALPDLKL